MSGTIWCQADSANSWHASRAVRGWPWTLIYKQAICCHAAAAASKCRVLPCCPAASKNRSRFESLIGDKVWFSPSGPTVHSAPDLKCPLSLSSSKKGPQHRQAPGTESDICSWESWCDFCCSNGRQINETMIKVLSKKQCSDCYKQQKWDFFLLLLIRNFYFEMKLLIWGRRLESWILKLPWNWIPQNNIKVAFYLCRLPSCMSARGSQEIKDTGGDKLANDPKDFSIQLSICVLFCLASLNLFPPPVYWIP